MMKLNLNLRNSSLKDVAFYFLLTASLMLNMNIAKAESNTIKFESGSWEEIKAKAAKEDKLIFLDAYTTWCGICKKMAKNVFTDDAVASYYNGNFINAKINMESGEGIAIAKQYNINVYPTFLFIDGQGKVIHREVGGLQPLQFIELAQDAQNPIKQNSGLSNTHEGLQTFSNKFEIGFHISQYQRDFGVGLHVISPYFLWKSIALKVGSNLQWFENSNGIETTWSTYQNIQLGVRGRGARVTENISIYGEGGILFILPNSDFSSRNFDIGGYGLFGFEFRIVPQFAYFIELGGIGSGATADQVAGKPIYSNGFLTNVGLKIGF